MLSDLHDRLCCPIKRARRKDARPGELLEAALALFIEKGFGATRMEDVASQAGVSKGTVFRYYPSKEDLFKAVVRQHLTNRFSEWSSLIEQFDGDTETLLKTCAHAWWMAVGQTPAGGLDWVIMNEGHQFPELVQFFQQEVMAPGNQLVERILRRGIQRGDVRNIDIQYGVYAFVAMMLFLSLWQYKPDVCIPHHETLDAQRYLDSQIDILLHGMCKPSPSTPPTGNTP